ncbi:MAG: acyl-CoA dehydrogenase family protein [Deltaproteobacteria bacterium]|nr:acyl-CoA dehydrogenase family protein [Deltaproteobacteria bacterium]
MYRNDYGLSDELKMFQDTIRKFVKNEILPVEHKLDPDAIEFPKEEIERLREKTRAMGMYQPAAPVEFGGAGLDFFANTLFMEEVSKHRQGLYNAGGGVFGYAVNPILYMGTEEQKEKYLKPCIRGEMRGCFAITEPSGGSDPARAIRTRARKTDRGWVLNGSKTWISFANQAKFVTVFVRTDDGPIGTRGEITCFIVESGTPGYTISSPIPVIRPEAPYELIFEDCLVPEAQMLGRQGGGFELLTSLLTQNRIPYAAQCVGIAQEALEMAIAYSKIRETFGKPLSDRQAIQWMLADSALEIHAARLVVYNAARCRAENKPFRIESSMAKLMASEVALNVVDRAIQIHGGMGLSKELPLERWYRELRTRRIGEGPSEVHRMVISRELLS